MCDKRTLYLQHRAGMTHDARATMTIAEPDGNVLGLLQDP
jgi:hypothetical protein